MTGTFDLSLVTLHVIRAWKWFLYRANESFWFAHPYNHVYKFVYITL